MRIGMRHQLIRLLRRAVETERMIDIVRGGERHFSMGAVERRRGSIEEMATVVVAATFQNIAEADEIGIDIGVWIDQRVANARLRREGYNKGKPMLAKKRGGCRAVREIKPHEFEILRAGKLLQAALFQICIVIG